MRLKLVCVESHISAFLVIYFLTYSGLWIDVRIVVWCAHTTQREGAERDASRDTHTPSINQHRQREVNAGSGRNSGVSRKICAIDLVCVNENVLNRRCTTSEAVYYRPYVQYYYSVGAAPVAHTTTPPTEHSY